MAAGLKIGTKYSWKEWKQPLLLVGIVMPVSIVVVTVICHYFLKFDLALSLLLASLLTPTDPVFASDLQLEDKADQKKNTGMRYVLTAEAGINDGLAFPFVWLAILWSKTDIESFDFWHWFNYYVVFKIAVGVAIGSFIGYVYSYTVGKFSAKVRDKILDGFVAVSLTLLSYGFTEMCGGYGFLAVFFTGLLAQYHHHQNIERHPENEMILFVEETEKFFVVIWIILFGASLASGVLSLTNEYGVLLALFFVLLLRPITGYLTLASSKFSVKKKWATAFFGIRGIGSVFYLSYALIHGTFDQGAELYAIVSYVLLFSIILHGLSAKRVVRYFKKTEPG